MEKISLPDFNDILELTDRIAKLTKDKMIIENNLEVAKASIVRKCMFDSAYWVNGKQPSMEFIKTTYMVTGFDGELVEQKMQLAETISELDRLKLRFQVYRDVVDVWRTMSANERMAL